MGLKENNGRAARRQLLKKLSVVVAIFLALLGTLYVVETSSGSESTLRHSLRRKMKRQKELFGMGDGGAKLGTNGDMDRILAAELHLINIDVDSHALRKSSSEDYKGVHGIFCALNFEAHKADPSSGRQEHCEPCPLFTVDSLVCFPGSDLILSFVPIFRSTNVSRSASKISRLRQYTCPSRFERNCRFSPGTG